MPSSAPPTAAGHAEPLPSDADAAAPEPAEDSSESPAPAPRPAPVDDDAQLASGAPACPGTTPGADPAPDPADAAATAPEAAPPAPPDVSPRRSGIPSRSAASCNHSGGLSRNDVWLRSTRAGGAGAGS
ncbi:hypothetical protein ACMAVT_09570 [Streptomyces sp. FW42]